MIESYYKFTLETIKKSETDPLILEWIERLNLESENIEIIADFSKDGYAGIYLRYNQELDKWIISYTSIFESYHIIHKLGYLWLWKKLGVLSAIKERYYKYPKEYHIILSAIMDNIVFHRFCKMDNDFKKFLFNFTINEAKYFYNGASWNHPFYSMYYRYVVQYLTYNYIWDQDLRNKYSNYIMVELLKRQNELIEKAEIEKILFNKGDIRKLNGILRCFEPILDCEEYPVIFDYIMDIYSLIYYRFNYMDLEI